MRKTNLRINNVFIIEDNGKHYLSNIDDPDEWSNLESSGLKKEGKDITKTLQELMVEYGISSNVNFFGFNQKGGGECDKDVEGGSDYEEDDGDDYEDYEEDDGDDEEDYEEDNGEDDEEDNGEDDEEYEGGGDDDLKGGSSWGMIKQEGGGWNLVKQDGGSSWGLIKQEGGGWGPPSKGK